MILTQRGEVAAEKLKVGDMIRTRDHKLPKLRWLGRRDLGPGDMIAGPHLRPIRIDRRALGHGLPLENLTVSPWHRLLVPGWRAEMLFGEPEVLVAATHLSHLPGISRPPARPVSYFHPLFDQHEPVPFNGRWSESFQPAKRTLKEMDPAQRVDLFKKFPARSGPEINYPAARATLSAFEARVLLPQ